MRLLYNIGVGLYSLAIKLASPFNPKAKLFVNGRKNWEANLRSAITDGPPIVWIHCASLGEFEQGRPVLEAIKKEYPNHRILLTFFSPSGYEIRKDYKLADWVHYLPVDRPSNARKFVEIVQPTVAIFVKYEFWFQYLNTLKQSEIPTYIISSIFRPKQHFFRWYGGWFRKMLDAFDHIFVQSETSQKLLSGVGVNHVSISGDTRFDRVHAVTENAFPIPIIEAFKQETTTVIAGSTWPADERLFIEYLASSATTKKFIIAPHEVDEQRIQLLMNALPEASIRYSEASVETIKSAQVLVIDNIGMLSNLYQYAEIAMIGGGFGRGIHNTLEAATFGLPIIFGPNYQKFKEARDLIRCKGAVSVKDQFEFTEAITHWIGDSEPRNIAGKAASDYVHSQRGATDKIMQVISKHLTREAEK
jgi:3-deoxy-D-manno-octulosonic-acid transferase